MHMLEGLLSLWAASGERRYLDRATAIFELFRSHFFLPEFGVLGEYFDADLRSASGESGRIVEPGHHYEWIWLLRWFERETGQSVKAWVDPLYAHADRFGFDADGLIVDEVMADGSVHLASHRIWPLTEAIKANFVEAAAGRPGAAEKTAALAEGLLERYLRPAVRGGWIDRLDPQGKPSADSIPASTLYHLICAIAELTPEG
jgi:mannose-6-phosphate isomerase